MNGPSDIPKRVDDSTLSISAPPEIMVRNHAVRLSQSAMRKALEETSPRFRRNLNYARKLASSIRFTRIHLAVLQMTWAPTEKTAFLKSRLSRQKFRLKKITAEIEFTWLDACEKIVDARIRHQVRLSDAGVRRDPIKHDRLGFCPRSKTYILWDNW